MLVFSAIFLKFKLFIVGKRVVFVIKFSCLVQFASNVEFSIKMDDLTVKDNTLISVSSTFHNNNFKTGYVRVENMKPEMKGRKTFAFWTLLILLFLLVIGNLALTIIIIGVLKLGQGMQSIELVPEYESIKLFGEVDLDHIYKRNGKLESFQDQPMEITSNDSPLLLNLARNGRVTTKVKIDPAEILLKGYNVFDVKEKENETIFSVNKPVFKNLRNSNTIKTKFTFTNKIRSPIDDDLKVDGEMVNLKGAEGSQIESREIVWSADQDIYLKSINGSIVLSTKTGIFIDLNRVPLARLSSKNYITSQFKVCVCMPEGKLFRIPVLRPSEKAYCHHINTSLQHNPCI